MISKVAYLVAENRIFRDQIKRRVQLSDTERRTLAEMGKKLSKQALEDVASIVKPDTILAWYRQVGGPEVRRLQPAPVLGTATDAYRFMNPNPFAVSHDGGAQHCRAWAEHPTTPGISHGVGDTPCTACP